MKKKVYCLWLFIALLLFKPPVVFAQSQDPVQFTVTMPNPADHTFHIVLECKVGLHETARFKMPAWSPGYYQIMDFEAFVSNFQVTDQEGKK